MYVLPKSRGYTLVELLIGLSIITILFVAGYTGYRDFSRRQVLNTSVETLKSELNNVRSQTLTAERPSTGECYDTFLGYVVIFTQTGYTVRPDCDKGDPGPLSSYYKTYTFPSTITVVVVGTANPNQILFKPVGGGTDVTNSNGATITLTESTSQNIKTITIFPSGAIK